MKNTIVTIVMLQGILLANAAFAVPHSFKANTPASAQEVNDNFTDVESQITSSATNLQNQININTTDIGALKSASAIPLYDYRTYAVASNITRKVFTTTKTGCGITEERNYTFGTSGDNTTVAIERVRYNQSSTRCQTTVFNYLNTPTERLQLGRQDRDAAGSVLAAELTFDTPIVYATSAMVQGVSFGSFSEYSISVGGTGTFMQNSIALGLEDVSVPANNYTGCLKMSLQRASEHFGSFVLRYSWYCPGVGEVKRIISGMAIDSSGVEPRINYITTTWRLSTIE